MPTRVLLEGPAIEPLLAQVREQYGSSARIISADKVRSGGLGGFFARERYELAVEVSDELMASIADGGGAAADLSATGNLGPTGPTGPAGAGGTEPAESLEQLLARAAAQDRMPSGTEAAPDADVRAAEPAGALPPRAAMVSTNGAAFAEVMAGLGGTPTAEPAAALAPAARREAPTVRPFRPAAVSATPVNAGSATPVNSVSGIPARTGEADDVLAATTPEALLAALTQTAAPARPEHPAGAPVPAAATTMPAAGYPAYSQPSAGPAARYAAYAPAAAPAQAPAAPAPAQAPAPAPTAVTTPVEPLVAEFARLGMPEALAARATGPDAYAATLIALADLPQAPAAPDRPGDILVIAGELAQALPVARQVLEDLRLDAARLLLAGPSVAGTGIHPTRRISGPAEAERRARRLHRADTPHVVVIDAPISGANAEWVRDTCDALGATAVWVVADATRKTTDSQRHVEALGDVEAIVVYGLASTADPASVLGIGVPVVSLDGRPATRHTWASVISERLTAETVAAEAYTGRRRRARGR